MIVSAGAALTAALLLTPGAQAAPPFNPEDDFSTTVDGKDSAEDVDKDVVNDLADEWSEGGKKDTEEDNLLPPDDQQDLNGMTEEDLSVGNDDDDILVGNDGDDDSIFITSADEEAGVDKTEDTQEFKAGVLDAGEPVDLLAGDQVADKDDTDLLLGLADDDVKEDDVIPLSEEDLLSTDESAEETDDLLPLDDLEQSALEEEPIETELVQEDESAEGSQDSELSVESPWDEQQSLQQDKDEESKPIPDDGLDMEETLVLDGEEKLSLDGEETLSIEGEETLSLDGEDTSLLDGEKSLPLDGEETSLLDSEETPVSDTDLLDNSKGAELGIGLDLDAAAEYKEEHPSEDDYIPVNDDGEIKSPVIESPEEYNSLADTPVNNDGQLTQDHDDSDLLSSTEETAESDGDVLTDEYQVDTTVQEINDSFEKALDAMQPENTISSQEDSLDNELTGAANDPLQAGFFPAENDNKSALIGDNSGSSTLNMLLVLAVLILVLFKLPKIKRWLLGGRSSNDQSSLPYHILRKRSQD